MSKTMILYRSPHHGNTKKLLDAIAARHPDIDMIQAGDEAFDSEPYDTIGIASGVYIGNLHRSVRKALEGISGNGRRAFVMYTCGDTQGEKYGKHFEALLSQHGFEPCGFYWCLGHDSVGPLRLVGGIHKGRPNAEDIEGAVKFYESLNP